MDKSQVESIVVKCVVVLKMCPVPIIPGVDEDGGEVVEVYCLALFLLKFLLSAR